MLVIKVENFVAVGDSLIFGKGRMKFDSSERVLREDIVIQELQDAGFAIRGVFAVKSGVTYTLREAWLQNRKAREPFVKS